MSDASPIALCPDTSSGSLLHRLAGQRGPESTPPKLIRIYLLVLAVAYVPLLVTVLISHWFGTVALWDGFKIGSLTFFEDWGLNYALLISLPSLVVMLVSDEYVLCRALDEVQDDRVLVPTGRTTTLKEKSKKYFGITNVVAQVVAIGLSIFLGVVTLRVYTSTNANATYFWVAPNGHPHVAGYIYTFCISLFYVAIILYITRSVAISIFLRALVRSAQLNILPLHSDRCGGLRPVGQVGLRNQYTLTILGINMVLLLFVWMYAMNQVVSFKKVLIVGSVVYAIAGPIIFMAPLLPFRAAMEDEKRKWTHDFARVVRVETDRLRAQLAENKVDEDNEKSIERLRKVGSAIDELPIWPFDPRTLRKFGTAYIVPVVLPVIIKALEALLNLK